MNQEKYISLQDALKELGISAVGLDKHIKKKNIQKSYERKRAYLKRTDYEVIAKEIELNGRVKKVLNTDREEIEKQANEEILHQKINELETTISELKEDKEYLKKSLDNTQKALDQEQILRFQEVNQKKELQEKYNQTVLLLEEKNRAVSSIEDEKSKLKNEIELKDKVYTNLIKEKEALLETAATIENQVTELKSELDIYKSQSFFQKLKNLFK